MTDALVLLRRAGWRPERRIETQEMLRALEGGGHVVVPPARELLATCSGLTIRHGARALRIDGWESARKADADWCLAYAEGIGRAVTPIGAYSHMTIVIDEVGDIWGGFDDYYGFMGGDVVELVRVLLVDLGARNLDRAVAPLSDHGGGCL